MSDFQAQILARLAILERELNNRIRVARVHKKDTKRNMVRLELQGKSDGKEALKTPWIRTSNTHGFANENVPMEEGQTVCLISMDGDFRNALALPYSNSKQDPLPKDAGKLRHTYRVRKPRKSKDEEKKGEESQEEGGGEQNGGGGGMFGDGDGVKDYKPEEFEEQKDEDDNDYIHTRNYAGETSKKGKASWGMELFNETENGEEEQQQQQAQQSQSGQGGQGDDDKDEDRDYFPGKYGDPDEQQQGSSGSAGAAMFSGDAEDVRISQFAGESGGSSQGGGKKEKKHHTFMTADKARVDVWDKRVTVRHGDKSRSDYTDGKQIHKVGGATITITDGKIELKVGSSILAVTNGKVFTVGITALGSEDASRALSLKDTIDSAGHTEVGNLATKVKGE